tara:strand:+ start:4466 stop:5593 length:1128 start_codon:yes stop_codon:yes gene_type:complete
LTVLHSQKSLRHIYADYNATTPLRPDARTAILEVLNGPGNPSSVHMAGRRARSSIEKARGQLSELIGCSRNSIIFTSGGTESDVLALRGSGCENILISSIEHDAVRSAFWGAKQIPVLGNGILNVDVLERLVSGMPRPYLVSVMWANNETGAIQPIKEVREIVTRYGGFVHVDAVQALGKIPLNFMESGVDMISLSAHKIGGPPGVGALVVRDGFKLDSIFSGGGQENGRRSGTENLTGIVGFGAAAEACLKYSYERKQVTRLRDLFESRISDVSSDAQIICKDVERLGNTSAISMPGMAAETQVMAFDIEGIAVSAGAACSSGKVKQSHVLKAMNLKDEIASNTIRISFGWENTEEEVEQVASVWQRLYKRAMK